MIVLRLGMVLINIKIQDSLDENNSCLASDILSRDRRTFCFFEQIFVEIHLQSVLGTVVFA